MSEQPPIAPFDAKDFRAALGSFVTGVTIITTRGANGKRVGLTANSFNSVSLSPPLVLFSLSQFAPSLPSFQDSTHFAVNILAADQMDLANSFAKRSEDKCAGVAFRESAGGAPVLDGVAASFTCRNEFRYYGGDHVIFIGAVVEYAHADLAPLVFARGRYVDVVERKTT